MTERSQIVYNVQMENPFNNDDEIADSCLREPVITLELLWLIQIN